jgi:hypothetical protein
MSIHFSISFNMRSQIFAAVAALSASVSAFPAIALEAAQIAARNDATSEAAKAAHERRLNGILPGFDAAAQLIDVSGAHAFTPPDFSAGDLRGWSSPSKVWASLTSFRSLPGSQCSCKP